MMNYSLALAEIIENDFLENVVRYYNNISSAHLLVQYIDAVIILGNVLNKFSGYEG